MRIFGRDLTLKGITEKALAPVSWGGWGRGTFFPVVHEPFTGAWQRNISLRTESSLEHFAVYACVHRIASDISKLPWDLLRSNDGIWEKVKNPAYEAVLHRPNRYQNHQQFKEFWMVSKLVAGNTYILKERDKRGVVKALYILDPNRVEVLVADDGGIYYRLQPDNIASLELNGADEVVVPSSEIIHDRYTPLFHPLIGVAPMIAYAHAASNGLEIQKNSNLFWTNAARPSGIITMPGKPTQDQVDKFRAAFQQNFKGENAGNIALLSDGMTFSPMAMSPIDSQLIEQLKLSADIICAVFGVPKHFVLGPDPTLNNVESLGQQYYTQCLQSHIESIEYLMDDGLNLDTSTYSIELDLGAMLRMDTAARYKSYTDAIGGGWMGPNEARARENLRPVKGGDTPYLQQQNYSLEALGRRDEQEDLWDPKPTPSATANNEQEVNENPESLDSSGQDADTIDDEDAEKWLNLFSQKLMESGSEG